jgi:hypothetical protein
LSTAAVAADQTVSLAPEDEARRQIILKIQKESPRLEEPSELEECLLWTYRRERRQFEILLDGATFKANAIDPDRHQKKHADSRGPGPSDLLEILDQLDLRFFGCKTRLRRLVAIVEMRDARERIKRAPEACRFHGTREWLAARHAAIASDPRPYGEIAEDHGVSETTVKRIKKKAGTAGRHGGSRPGAGRKSRVTV